MQEVATQLDAIIEKHFITLQQIPEEVLLAKRSATAWSKQEIMGHLIDSAHTNLRRFVVAQYEHNPTIVYAQDQWVSLVNYQQWDRQQILLLWFLLNKQICQVLRNMPLAHYQRSCTTQQEHTLQWLAPDYVKHLLHHLQVVLDLEPVPYP